MKILFACSEIVPLIKTGGLADVCGALPLALRNSHYSIRIIMPAYGEVLDKLKSRKVVSRLFLSGIPGDITLWQSSLPNTKVKLYLVEYAPAFAREGNPYQSPKGHPWQDNAERYTLFGRAVTEVALNHADLDWQPDLVHCNDWQTGLVPALLDLHPQRPATVFTIHNLAYQGLFPHETFQSLALPQQLWSPTAMEFHNQFSMIKGGLVYADQINTVSAQYAKEIQTEEFGYGLEGLLRHRRSVLHGIVNGIDDQVWNPATDTLIDSNYDSDSLEKKTINKKSLQQQAGLPVDNSVLLLGFIGRLVEQKGIDLIIAAMQQLLSNKQSAVKDLPAIQLVLLGSGDSAFESQLKQLAEDYPKQISVTIGYDEAMAHRIEAGVDAFLMPSRFEPCGLNQLYSLRYGTLPIVHHVGGLADTVVDTTEETIKNHSATGFVFDNPGTQALTKAIDRCRQLYTRQKAWQQVMLNAMNKTFNWADSAAQYRELYKLAIKVRKKAVSH